MSSISDAVLLLAAQPFSFSLLCYFFPDLPPQCYDSFKLRSILLWLGKIVVWFKNIRFIKVGGLQSSRLKE